MRQGSEYGPTEGEGRYYVLKVIHKTKKDSTIIARLSGDFYSNRTFIGQKSRVWSEKYKASISFRNIRPGTFLEFVFSVSRPNRLCEFNPPPPFPELFNF